MTNIKSTKRALLLSALSLLLCVSMLVGSTFAWFTDNVTSTNNIIKSGNLDVELEYYDGDSDSWEKVTATTNVFEENTLWEPGHTEVVYLKVSNIGTLALKYNLGVNIAKETEGTNVAGEAFKLSDYIYYDATDLDVNDSTPFAPYETREDAMKLATETTKISNSYTKVAGLESGEADYVALVVYMPETVGNEANYKTGTVAPQIDLGIDLFATQYTYEKDSFDNRYDGEAFIPVADVDDLGPQTVDLATSGQFVSNIGESVDLDASFSFKTTEDETASAESGYRYWNADFVVSADKDIKANSIALAGYYAAYCDLMADGKWIALTSDEAITAGTEIRLLKELMGASGGYEELCQWIPEFLCGIADLTGGNAGTTVTVELRLYETTKYSGDTSGSANIETGEYITIGTYSYTFPAAKVSNQEGLDAAVAVGANKIELAAGEYTFPAGDLKANMTLVCAEGTVFTGNSKANINGATVIGATFSNPTGTTVDQTINGTFKDCDFVGSNALRWCYAGETVVFENCTFSGDVYGVHFDGGANDATFKNCTFSGFNAFGAAITNLTLDGCTFKANGRSGYNGVNLWGSADVKNCTFVFDGSTTEWVDACGDNTTLTFTGCKISNGSTVRDLGASDVRDYGTGNTITVKNA